MQPTAVIEFIIAIGIPFFSSGMYMERSVEKSSLLNCMMSMLRSFFMHTADEKEIQKAAPAAQAGAQEKHTEKESPILETLLGMI